MTYDQVPLMYQAQVKGRGQIQYVAENEKADQWVRQWIKAAAQSKPKLFCHADNKEDKEYQIIWRFITNSGQDEGLIRPVIGAKGWPFYPGASMKGAFLRACNDQEALRYCGGKTSNQDTKPGILRFHGGYPKNWDWTQQELVDIVHPQENWQVKNNDSHSAFILISLYQPSLVFRISSTETLTSEEWEQIWKIWEQAIAKGIGSRVSAGYGQLKSHGKSNLLSVCLQGQGLASQLINKTGEFRHNMFKAALRGHTLRLFSGVTDQETAQELTQELWGGIAGENGAVVGKLGIAFQAKPGELTLDIYHYQKAPMPIYDLTEGKLNILCMGKVSDRQRKQLGLFTTQLIKFSMLLSGFGKSWRRVDHRLFFESYLRDKSNPMIGCHWQFAENSKSERFYIPVNELSDVTTYLNNLRQKILLPWLKLKKKTPSNAVSDLREAWHPEKVQVWGRIAKDRKDSHAIRWFHSPYEGNRQIKGTDLTGRLGVIGRIWHRMYPRYTKVTESLRATGEYVELLTIFPDNSKKTQEFILFLHSKSEFTLLWGGN